METLLRMYVVKAVKVSAKCPDNGLNYLLSEYDKFRIIWKPYRRPRVGRSFVVEQFVVLRSPFYEPQKAKGGQMIRK